MDRSEALVAETPGREGRGKAPEVAVDDGLVDDPADASGVPHGDDRFGEGEDDGDRRPASGRCAVDDRAARGSLDIRGVHDDEATGCEAPLELAVEDLEGEPCRALVAGVARDRLSIGVG
jgi:hypothetical protein